MNKLSLMYQFLLVTNVFNLQAMTQEIKKEQLVAKIDEKNKDGETQLYKAVIQKNEPLVRILLLAGATVDLLTKDDAPALYWACWTQDKATVKTLLEFHAKPNFVMPNGSSPLIVACTNDDTDLVEILLNHGALPAITSKHWEKILLKTSLNNNARILTMLHEHNAQHENKFINSQQDKIVEKIKIEEQDPFLEEMFFEPPMMTDDRNTPWQFLDVNYGNQLQATDKIAYMWLFRAKAHLHGTFGVDKDCNLAREYFSKVIAANRNNTNFIEACVELGKMYYQGNGIPKQVRKAEYCLSQAINKNLPAPAFKRVQKGIQTYSPRGWELGEAYYFLALITLENSKDTTKAKRYFEKAIEMRGDFSAEYVQKYNSELTKAA